MAAQLLDQSVETGEIAELRLAAKAHRPLRKTSLFDRPVDQDGDPEVAAVAPNAVYCRAGGRVVALEHLQKAVPSGHQDAGHPVAQIVGEGRAGDRRHAEGEAQEEDAEALEAAAQLAPGDAEGEAHSAAAVSSGARRPSARRYGTAAPSTVMAWPVM